MQIFPATAQRRSGSRVLLSLGAGFLGDFAQGIDGAFPLPRGDLDPVDLVPWEIR